MPARRSYLFVTFEGGGNVPPVLGLARRLAARGHDVRVLTEPCLRAAVEDGTVDLAVVRGPISASPGVVAESVYREPLVVAAYAAHPLAVSERVPLGTLRGEPMVLFHRHLAPEFHDWLTRLCMDAGFVPVVAHNGAEYQTILSLVAAEVGISLVPASVRSIAPSGVRFLPLADCEETAEIDVVYRPDRMFGALAAFLQTLRDIHRELPDPTPGPSPGA